jgi:hypothetical protein
MNALQHHAPRDTAADECHHVPPATDQQRRKEKRQTKNDDDTYSKTNDNESELTISSKYD